MASEIETLTAIGRERNPVQENQYRQLLDAQGKKYQIIDGKAVAAAGAGSAGGLAANSQDFLGRYTSGLQGAISGLEGELGLPGLRQTTATAGQAARDVAQTLSAVAPTQQTIAKQVGISAPRLQQRIAAKTAELAPSMSAAQKALEDATSAQQFGETQFTQRLGLTMKPFEVEAGLLGEQVKNDFDLYKTKITNDLTREINQLTQTGLNDRAALDRAEKLAEAEQALTKGTFQDLGDRIVLINPVTGKQVTSFSKGAAPTAALSGW